MASLRRNKALSPDGETAKFLYTIIKQLDLKTIDWNIVAEGLNITNGHAARMRYSRFKQHIEGIPTISRSAKNKKDGKQESKAAKGQKRKSPEGEEGSKSGSKSEHMHEPVKEEVFKTEAAGSDVVVATVKPEPSIKPEPGLDLLPQPCVALTNSEVKLEEVAAKTIQSPNQAWVTKVKQEPGAKKRSPSGLAKPKPPVTAVQPEPELIAPTPAVIKLERAPAAPMEPFVYPPPSGWYPIPTPQFSPLFHGPTEAITFDVNPFGALHSPPQMNALPTPPEMRPLHPPPDMTTIALSDLNLTSPALLRAGPSAPYGAWTAQSHATWPEHSAPATSHGAYPAQTPAMEAEPIIADRGVRPSSAQPQAAWPEQSMPAIMEGEAHSATRVEPDVVRSKDSLRPAVKPEEDQPMLEVVPVKSEPAVT